MRPQNLSHHCTSIKLHTQVHLSRTDRFLSALSVASSREPNTTLPLQTARSKQQRSPSSDEPKPSKRSWQRQTAILIERRNVTPERPPKKNASVSEVYSRLSSQTMPKQWPNLNLSWRFLISKNEIGKSRNTIRHLLRCNCWYMSAKKKKGKWNEISRSRKGYKSECQETSELQNQMTQTAINRLYFETEETFTTRKPGSNQTSESNKIIINLF